MGVKLQDEPNNKYIYIQYIFVIQLILLNPFSQYEERQNQNQTSKSYFSWIYDVKSMTKILLFTYKYKI